MLLDLIYPPVCGICDKINKKNLCKKCELKIKKYEINKIEDCRKDKLKYFDYHIKIFRYENIIRDKIIDYKFNEKAYLYKTFEKMILKTKKTYSFLKKYDIILYVPMFKKHKLIRGYNQSELIARKISDTLGITLEKNNLAKVINTKKQSTLTKSEREKNVKNAFKLKNPEKIKDKKVILFDDIYTTGSTVNECSKILKKAGATEIAILTIAVD
mgnify:FL=1